MQNNLDISVIIPTYNANKCIERCINSIMKQSILPNEIIIVNDGSTDSTADVIKKLSLQNNLIKLIFQENAGVAIARNTGISYAKSKYIWFVDADDEVEEGSFEALADNNTNADLYIGAFTTIIKKYNKISNPCKDCGQMTIEKFIEHFVDNPHAFFYGAIWNKLYKREIILENDLLYDFAYSWGEDFIFNMNYYACCKNVIVLKECMYKYYRETNGLTAKSLVSIAAHPAYNFAIKAEMYHYYKNCLKQLGLYDQYKARIPLFVLGISLLD